MNRQLCCALAGLALTVLAGCPGVFNPPDGDGNGGDGAEVYEPTAVVLWNEAMLAAIRSGPPRPTVISRSIFIVQSAEYDAWTAYDAVANPTTAGTSPRRPAAEHTMANKRAAVSYAAYRALTDQFPAYETNTRGFTRLLEELGYEVSDSMDPTTPAGIGNLAAQRILDFREGDGSNEANNYAPITSDLYPEPYVAVNSADPTSDRAPGGENFDPNRWAPLRVPNGTLRNELGHAIFDNADPTTYADQAYLGPHWGAVVPFGLTRGDEFQPPPPPLAGSDAPYTDSLGNSMTNDEAYHMQLDDVLQLSAELDDERKVITEYWEDGPRSETPPGHWNAIAHGVAYRDRHTLDDDVKMFFALAGATFDSGIAVWDCKRVYDYVRPISAIRHKYFGQQITAWGGPGQGIVQMNGEEWLPYQSLTFLTPPFSEYNSGHSCFSSASAEVLTLFTGDETYYDGETILYNEDFNRDGLPDLIGEYVALVGTGRNDTIPAQIVTLRWNTFKDAANQAGISRRYGGIHFQDADFTSREMGERVGQRAYQTAMEYWTGAREPRYGN